MAKLRRPTLCSGVIGEQRLRQRAAKPQAVEDFLNGGNGRLVAEFTEIESGKQSDRPALAKAFQACRLRRAKLVIAKLDRLSRDAHFLLGLEKAGVDFVAADMPTANRLTVGIMAMIADEERRMISKRTKEALASVLSRARASKYILCSRTCGDVPSRGFQRMASTVTVRRRNWSLRQSAGTYWLWRGGKGALFDKAPNVKAQLNLGAGSPASQVDWNLSDGSP